MFLTMMVWVKVADRIPAKECTRQGYLITRQWSVCVYNVVLAVHVAI